MFLTLCLIPLMSFNNCCCLVARVCSTLCDPMDGSLPGSSIHGSFQARIPEWVDTHFSRGSSWSKDRTHVSCIGREILYHWATQEAPPVNDYTYTTEVVFSWGPGRMSELWVSVFLGHGDQTTEDEAGIVLPLNRMNGLTASWLWEEERTFFTVSLRVD